MKKIAIFASGTGSNAMNLLEKAALYPSVQISCVVVDTAHSQLLQNVARKFPNVTFYQILPDQELKGSDRKFEHESRVLSRLRQHQIEWILLAGYMRLIGPTLLEVFSNHMINIHPSLLPVYPGLNAYERAYADGVSSGVTIHLVDNGMDTGPIILQRSFARMKEDSLGDFIQRGKNLEWDLYPEILKKINDSVSLLQGD